MRMGLALMVLLFDVMACSGSSLAPGAGNDPGTQTGSLRVTGLVIARPLHRNARTADEFTSEFRVSVIRGNAFPSTVTVTVTSATGTVPLTSPQSALGDWTGSAPGYDEVYVLDVVNGTNRRRSV